MIKAPFIGFGDIAVERRKIKSKFFNQKNALMDWQPICRISDKHYLKGQSATWGFVVSRYYTI